MLVQRKNPYNLQSTCRHKVYFNSFYVKLIAEFNYVERNRKTLA